MPGEKISFEDEQDLRQYVYLAMLVNAKFDELPQFAKVLHDKTESEETSPTSCKANRWVDRRDQEKSGVAGARPWHLHTHDDIPEADRTRVPFDEDGFCGKTYPKDECLECGAIVKMGFFFDAFGRNKDKDEEHLSFYSNVSRLWRAHRSMESRNRPSTHYWLRFYYSGLGADLNREAEEDGWITTALMATQAIGDHAWKKTKSTAQDIVGILKIEPSHAPRKPLRRA